MIRFYLYRHFPIVFCSVIGIASFSCKKELAFETPKAIQEVVVDGWIENDGFAKVLITKSSGYFNNLDSAEMVDLIVRFAKVTISNGAETEVLTLKKDTNLFPPFYYQTTEIKGEVGKSYSIKVELRNKEYTASTTITEPVKIDSIYYIPSKEDANKGYIHILFQDPKGPTYYRVFTKRKGKDFVYKPTYISTFNDGVKDGKTMSVELVRGLDIETQESRDFRYEKGDTVFIRLCTMDKQHFDFWKFADGSVMTSSNPFAISSNNSITNIEGGIGNWGGYGSSYYLFIVR